MIRLCYLRVISYSHTVMHVYQLAQSVSQSVGCCEHHTGIQLACCFTWMIMELGKYFCYQKMWWHQPISGAISDTNDFSLEHWTDWNTWFWWFTLVYSIHGASFQLSSCNCKIPVGRGCLHHGLNHSWNLERTFLVRARTVLLILMSFGRIVDWMMWHFLLISLSDK